jgi:hypothetical protein
MMRLLINTCGHRTGQQQNLCHSQLDSRLLLLLLMLLSLPPEVAALVLQHVLRERGAMDTLGALAATCKPMRDTVRGFVRRVALPNTKRFEASSAENVAVLKDHLTVLDPQWGHTPLLCNVCWYCRMLLPVVRLALQIQAHTCRSISWDSDVVQFTNRNTVLFYGGPGGPVHAAATGCVEWPHRLHDSFYEDNCGPRNVRAPTQPKLQADICNTLPLVLCPYARPSLCRRTSCGCQVDGCHVSA